MSSGYHKSDFLKKRIYAITGIGTCHITSFAIKFVCLCLCCLFSLKDFGVEWINIKIHSFCDLHSSENESVYRFIQCSGFQIVYFSLTEIDLCIFNTFDINCFGSSLFLMDKMLFQFNRVGFCDDVHTKQRRSIVSGNSQPFSSFCFAGVFPAESLHPHIS